MDLTREKLLGILLLLNAYSSGFPTEEDRRWKSAWIHDQLYSREQVVSLMYLCFYCPIHETVLYRLCLILVSPTRTSFCQFAFGGSNLVVLFHFLIKVHLILLLPVFLGDQVQASHHRAASVDDDESFDRVDYLSGLYSIVYSLRSKLNYLVGGL